MAGKARVWLAVGVVAVLVGFALWRKGPAAQAVAASAEAPAVQAPSPSAPPPDAPVTSTANLLSVEARRVKEFEGLKQRAKAGDAVAQRMLADTYEACFIVNIDRENFLKGLDYNKQMIRAPAQLSILEKTAQERFTQCGAVDGGAIIPLALIFGWYEQAAENGDLAARLNDNAYKHKTLDAAESSALLEEVLASNDPAVLFAMGATLGPRHLADPNDPAYALVSGERAGNAWMVAACRMGYDCGPSSALMGNFCLGTNGCTGEDFETFWKRQLPSDAERRDLERRVTEILRLVEGQ